MKNRYRDYVIVVIMLWLLFEVLLQKKIVFDTISYSLNVWVNNLLPSMFPFFVISDILIEYRITNYIPKWFKKTFSYLFAVKEEMVTVFFLSCLSGFPSNARITRHMYDEGQLSTDEANHILLFTHFSNPLFILSTVAVLFLHQEKYGYIILLSHFLGNIVLGIFTRKNFLYSHIDYTETQKKSQSFSKVLIHAVKSSIDTLLLILGTLTCFLIFSTFLIQKLNVDSYTGVIIKGILEITMGLKELSSLMIPDIYKVVISSMFLSFGGLSVHMQVLSQIVDTDIQYYPFFLARIFHALVSGFICFVLYYFLFS